MSKAMVQKELQERLTELNGALARVRTDERNAQRNLDKAMTDRDQILQLIEGYTQIIELMESGIDFDKAVRETRDSGTLIMTPEKIRERRVKQELRATENGG